ncbi:hypothetical protein MA16_Dca027982 [Dendrobium catenatum]|uniref:Transposase MuDR plant domain-containing protein n=1 Tax=Dendrobium catenatum TaxID=906689 RepID=A0A2I0V8R0_9ASPA|nr:hypothetical protein MA16_Dca027982 [Dendrobium catenatum]
MANNDVIVGGMSDGFIETPDLEDNLLVLGLCFEDSFSFKQSIRSNAIIHNYDINITSSDKSRVIATCSYRGCPWRIRALLCYDVYSFEVKKLHPTHLCPWVNRDGNKQATISWFAQEIQDIVKKI